jgi:hypothetical protein
MLTFLIVAREALILVAGLATVVLAVIVIGAYLGA